MTNRPIATSKAAKSYGKARIHIIHRQGYHSVINAVRPNSPKTSAQDPNPYSNSKYDRGRRQSVVSRPSVAIAQRATNHGADSQASGRAAVASPQAIPVPRERFGSSQMPRSDRLTPIGSSIPDESLKTLVGAMAAKAVAATATERFQ